MVVKYIILLILITLINKSTPIVVNCKFGGWEWSTVGYVYNCLTEDLIIDSIENRIITGKTGTHAGNQNDLSVFGFYPRNTAVRYFPQNLLEIFPNLVDFAFQGTKTREIHKEDFKPFGDKLEHFQFLNCEIEIIEKDLFKYNPNIKFLSLDGNRINFVDARAFNHLDKLVTLWMEKNECINVANVHKNRAQVEVIISKLKGECYRNFMILMQYEYQEKERIELLEKNESLRKEIVEIKNECSASKNISCQLSIQMTNDNVNQQIECQRLTENSIL